VPDIYVARFANCPADVTSAQVFRSGIFRAQGSDADRFDPLCDHVLVEEAGSGRLVCVYRVMLLKDGSQIDRSYGAQFYDLSRLSGITRPILEIGRFCVDSAMPSPDILRVAWAELARLVEVHNVALLFGCSSFSGIDPAAFADTFALLKHRHLAPDAVAPMVKSSGIVPFSELGFPDMKKAQSRMPPLLRTYLAMGGWVSDHAVIDRDMNTLHVFTGVEVDKISPARKRFLRGDSTTLDTKKTAFG